MVRKQRVGQWAEHDRRREGKNGKRELLDASILAVNDMRVALNKLRELDAIAEDSDAIDRQERIYCRRFNKVMEILRRLDEIGAFGLQANAIRATVKELLVVHEQAGLPAVHGASLRETEN